MPITVDLRSVQAQRAQIGTQLGYAQRFGGDPTGTLALASAVNNWSSVAPNAPAGILSSFATAGITPDSPLGNWLVTNGLPQLSSQDVVPDTPDRMTRGAAASKLLGNPTALQWLSTLPLEQVAKFNPSDLGAWVDDPKAFARVVGGHSAVHHASFMEHVGSAVGDVTRPVTAALASGLEGIEGAFRARQSLPNYDTGTALAASSGAESVDQAVAGLANTTQRLPFGASLKIGDASTITDVINQTTLGQNIVHGENLGRGLFAGGPAREQAIAAQQKASSVIFPGGQPHAWTPGRYFGALVTQPGTVPYNALSGAIDFTVAIKGDPAILLGNELQDAIKTSRVLAPTSEAAVQAAADHLMDSSPASKLAEIRAWTGADHIDQPDLRQAVIDKVTSDPGSLQDLVKAGTIDAADVASAIGRRYAGAVPGLRYMVDQPTALSWLNQGAGQRFADFAADKGFTDIWRATKGKIPVQIVSRLADTDDPGVVRQILGEAFNDASIRETPSATAPFTWLRPFDANRYTNFMPHGSIDVMDPDNAVEQAWRTLTQLHTGIPGVGKALIPREAWDGILSKIADATNGPEMYDAYVNGFGSALGSALTDHGVEPDLAKKLTQFFHQSWESDRKYAVDAQGNTPHVNGLLVDGNPVPMEGPFFWNQLLNRGIPPLDVKEIGRNIGAWGTLWNTPIIGPTMTGVDYAATKITQGFKIGTLAKLAMPVRFLADEQARMATAGFDSMFHHPISYIAWALGGRQGADAEFLNELAEHPLTTVLRHPAHAISQSALATVAGGANKAVEAKAMTDVLGHAFTDANAEHAYATTRALGGIAGEQGIDTGAVFAKHYDVVGRTSDKYLKGWWDELSQLHLDPVAREVARGMLNPAYVPAGVEAGDLAGHDAVKEWFSEGTGRRYRDDLAQADLWDHNSPALATNRAAADGYLDSVRQQILDKTASEPALMHAVATGDPFRVDALMPELRRELRRATKAGDVETADALRDRIAAATDVRSKLESMRYPSNDSYGNPMPAGPEMIRSAVYDPTQMGRGVLDKMVDKMFSSLMDVPSKQLTRSPVFRQAYWDRMDEMVPFMDETTAAQARAVAANEGVSLTNTPGGLAKLSDPDQADLIAKAYALKTTRNLLYYPAERSGIMSRLNVVAPFGEAWKNVITSWAKLAAENPVTVTRRTQQGVVDSRESGWWYTDPQDGVEKFTMVPGQVMQHLAGVPFALTGQVKGLNIVGSGLPGVGPAIQIAAAPLLSAFHSVPATQKLTHMLLPYGNPDFTGGTMELLFPGWIDKLRQTGWFNKVPFMGQSANQARVLDNVVKDVMQYKLSSGHWDLSNPDDALRLEHESMHDAQMLYLWRGLAQSVAPAAPSLRSVTQLKDGGLIETWLLAQDYRAMISQNSGDSYAATRQFINKYGASRIFATQAYSQPTIYGVPTTAQGEAWRTTHPDFAAKYKNVFGYWAPQGGAFDYQAYLDNIKSGDVKPLKPAEWLGLGEARAGNAVYDQLRQQLPSNPSTEQTQWLANAKTTIGQQFPGFAQDSLKASRDTPQQVIDELGRAVRDPLVSGTPLAHAAVVYLHLRDEALASAAQAGYTTLTGDAVANLRAWLVQSGGKIASDIPEFQTIWDNLLRPEVDK